MRGKSKRQRDYRVEYQRRLQRGRERNLSVSQSRGHHRAGERDLSGPIAYQPKAPVEQALRLVRSGATQRAAARQVGITPEGLRRFMKENTTVFREAGRWVILDERPVAVTMATRGRQEDVTVSPAAASDIGRHWNAVNRFLDTNNPSFLQSFDGMGVRDVAGKFHPYEARPNVLRRLDAIKRSARGWSEHPPIWPGPVHPLQPFAHLLLGVCDYLSFIVDHLSRLAEILFKLVEAGVTVPE